jgi:hypothetical protein
MNQETTEEQFSQLKNTQDLEQLKISLMLQQKDMEITVLQKALEGEQKLGKHLVECLNKMQERWDNLSAFCDKIMKESREKNEESREKNVKINELREELSTVSRELFAIKSEEEYRLNQLT